MQQEDIISETTTIPTSQEGISPTTTSSSSETQKHPKPAKSEVVEIKAEDEQASPRHRLRHQKLQAVLDRALTSVTDSFTLEDMYAALPELAKDIPEVLKDTHQQLCNYIHNFCPGKPNPYTSTIHG